MLFASVVLFTQFSWGEYFRTAPQKIQYLVHLRQNYPDIYRDFITRYNAFEFLETAQNAIEAVGFKNKTINGYSWDVFNLGEELVDRSYDVEAVRSKIVTTMGMLESQESIPELIRQTSAKAAKFDAITAGLAQTDPALGLREVLRISDPNQRLAEITKRVGHLREIEGINPKFLGLTQKVISGPELLALYSEAITNRHFLNSLVWLLQLSKDLPDHKAKAISELTLRVRKLLPQTIAEALLKKIDVNDFQDMELPKNTIAKIIKGAEEDLKKLSFVKVGSTQKTHIMSIMRSHPYDAFPRGSVGDCSTTNCFAMPLVSAEEYYWILRPDGSVKGYFQFTRIKVDGKVALYLNTISGSGISRADARAVFHTVATSLKHLGAEKIILPMKEKIPFIINFPEVAVVYDELLKNAKKVNVAYIDGNDRLKLLPYIEDSLDLPEKNTEGMEIKLQDVIDPKITSEIKNMKITPDHVFSKAKSTDILMVVLELRNREENIEGIKEVLRHYSLDQENFEKLWKIVSNEDKKTVAEFHRLTQHFLDKLNIGYNWKELVSSPLFFQGHMRAPDALVGANGNTVMGYVQILLKAYTDIPAVYELIGKNRPSLLVRNDFVDLVKSLFKKNIKEFDRLLDYYELEHRSAYRTLASLFEAGLTKDHFKSEIENLSHAWELNVSDPMRAHGVFFRRITLLGIIHEYSPSYFVAMMSRLEKMVKTGVVLNDDDIRTVASYLAAATNKDKLDRGQVQRMENFLMSSDMGMSFLPHFGIFSIEKINVPKLTDNLLSKGKYEWAAQLIHKGSWLKHPKAPLWMQQIWMHKDELSVDLILLGFQVNPDLLKVPGIERFVDDLMVRVKGNSQNEMALAKILISQTEKMTEQRISWLRQAENPDIKDMVNTYLKVNKLKSSSNGQQGRTACINFYGQ
ncbi:MAG: hypothetical protein JNL11_12990 [Bdellovibrionaceae bacterium]|nr:hypothetical protein [Pseudobdellovibrionaceae bacterium]